MATPTRSEHGEASSGVELAEVVAAIALAADLGLGQPLDHVLRSCVIATRFAEHLDVSQEDRDAAYRVTLFITAGCTGVSFELSSVFGDDIAFRSGVFAIGSSSLEQLRYMLGHAGSHRGPIGRARVRAGRPAQHGHERTRAGLVRALRGQRATRAAAGARGVGGHVAAANVRPLGRQGPAAGPGRGGHSATHPHRQHRQPRRLASPGAWRGGQDPRSQPVRWHRVRPGPRRRVVFGRAGSACRRRRRLVVGAGGQRSARGTRPAHRGGARRRAGAARGLRRPEVAVVHRSLPRGGVPGRRRRPARRPSRAGGHRPATCGAGPRHRPQTVPNSIWDKPGPLSASEIERVRLHAYYTDRVLRRASRLADLASVASAAHERGAGTGYPHGLGGATIPILGRFLEAADAYHAMGEDRPHRPALSREAAGGELRRAARSGELDGTAVDAVLTAAGHRARRKPTVTAGLTPREAEVLLLAARGRTTHAIAGSLGIAPKTAGNHIERIYAKIGVSSRAEAAMYAMQHGLIQDWESARP